MFYSEINRIYTEFKVNFIVVNPPIIMNRLNKIMRKCSQKIEHVDLF